MLNILFNVLEEIKNDFELDYVVFFLRIIYFNQVDIDLDFKVQVIRGFLGGNESFDYFLGLSFRTSFLIENDSYVSFILKEDKLNK
jgi:hypothetical protein